MKYLVIELTKKEQENIFSKINIDPITHCWNWNAAKSRGYGVINYRGKTMSIHRLIYAWMVNSIPMGVGQNIPVLDHLCNNTSCCNPKHLILGPQKYNILRGNSPITLNAKKTHCHRGHLLPIEPNESWGNKRKNRRCIICRRMNAKTRYHSKVSGINSQTFLESTREYSRKLWHGPKHQEFLEKHRKSNLLSYHRRRSLIVPPAD